MTQTARNALVEQYTGAIWWTIRRNSPMIRAAGLDVDDVFQQLALRMIRAIDRFDSDKGNLEQHIFAQLRYELLNCKRPYCLHGITGVPDNVRNLTVSLDAMLEDGVQITA